MATLENGIKTLLFPIYMGSSLATYLTFPPSRNFAYAALFSY